MEKLEIKATSVKEAWGLANRLFPTDYEKDEDRSSRAGYPIYIITELSMFMFRKKQAFQ